MAVAAVAACAFLLVLAVASHVMAADPPEHLGEGVLVTGRTATAQVGEVGLSGARVVTTDETDHTLWETSNNGTTWTATGGSSDAKPFQLEGSSLLTFEGTTAKVGGLTFPAADEVILGKGGKLVSHRIPNGASAEVYDVATNTKLADYAPPFAMSDSTVWKVTEPGRLTGKDLATGTVKTILVASNCTVGPDRVNGRWALLSGCNQVVDVRGPGAPRNLTVAADSQLGNGFTVQITPEQDVLVTDLNDHGLGQRRYGPVRGEPTSFRADGSGLAKIVYADPDSKPRVITLSWLTADPQQRPDTVAPVLTSASAGDRIRDNTSLSFEWAFTDPQDPNSPATGVATYDLRIQQRPNRTSPYGAWNQVPVWQGLKGTAASTTAPIGTDTCWQVRARDYAGNLSAWSTSYCSEVDGTAPKLVTLRIGDRVAVTAPVTFRWAYTEDTEVASYDVVYKVAAPGAALGKWMYPPAWQNTRIRSITWTPRLGWDECFLVRARDYLGNLSAWSPQICAVAPQDDRALTSAGSVTRSTSSLAFQGTTSILKANGAYLTKTTEAGARIALVAIHGPGQGRVDIYHANLKIGTVSLAAGTTSRKVTYLPITPFRTGAVKIVSTSTAPAIVDGIAFLRVNP
ncbi:hypothetical protein E1218_07285 [Kribbella turkmenica]|uniref:Fibronectin type-III domain-containing protein n=1 Tax=Kribbella turkmenica TaxID=2530375 RepID=A0A4R4XCN2_9ACTN|nr:hypothetical protein [Kribbella turkmenica]TDD28478.1 hypothetical protein E1218_07285 [Kribbella turkmenica]